jgi:hypothetical protein
LCEGALGGEEESTGGHCGEEVAAVGFGGAGSIQFHVVYLLADETNGLNPDFP